MTFVSETVLEAIDLPIGVPLPVFLQSGARGAWWAVVSGSHRLDLTGRQQQLQQLHYHRPLQ